MRKAQTLFPLTEETVPLFSAEEFPVEALPDEQAYSQASRKMRRQGVEPHEREEVLQAEYQKAKGKGGQARRKR